MRYLYFSQKDHVMFLILISVMLQVDNYGRCCPCNKKNENTFTDNIPQSDEKTLNGSSQKSFKPESYEQDTDDKKKENLKTETIKTKTEIDISQYQDEVENGSCTGLELDGISTFIESLGEYTLSEEQKEYIKKVAEEAVNDKHQDEHTISFSVNSKQNKNMEETRLKIIMTKHNNENKVNVRCVAIMQKGVISNQKK